jgi:glycoside/pentoside/hexuronide:cation symporter, GPH family
VTANPPLPWRVRLGYGVGDFGIVLQFQLAGLFLLFFLTDVLGIPPAVAGTIVLAGLVFDGITDIAMGVLADRARARLGGYRTWLLVGAPFLALSTALLFWAPALETGALIAFAVAVQLVFRAAFTVVAIPFMALSSALTSDSRERSLLVGIRLTSATLATLTIAVGLLPLVSTLGAGDQRRGFFLAAILVGVLGAAIVILTYLATRGRERLVTDEAPVPLGRLPALVLANRPFLLVCGMILTQALAQAFVLSGAAYFFTHSRGEPDTLGLSLGVLIGGVGLFVPVWTVIQRRIGKRATWLFGAVWSSLALAGLAATSQMALTFFLAAMALSAFGFAALGIAGFAMLPDTVEHGEWVTGTRVEAGLVSALTFAQKCASGLASWGVGLLLAVAGHTQATPMSGDAAVTFGVWLFAIPAIAIALSLPLAWVYRLDAAEHARLVERLAERRGGGA